MNDLDINKVYDYCKILNIECIKQEIEEKTKGYTLDKMELKNGDWICSFHKKNRKSIILTASINSVNLTSYNSNSIEIMEIDSNLLTSKCIDKRENGIVYSVLQKQFMPSNRFNNEFVLTDLIEERYVFTKNNLENLIDNFDFTKSRMMLFILKILELEKNNNLKKLCDFYSEFSTHMNDYYSSWRSSRSIKCNIYPTRTYLNGKEISSLYDIDGPDKLYRIFDLYKGIINSRNEKDLDSINLGFIGSSAYDLITFEGISEKENSLVGIPSETMDKEYLEYLKKLFSRNFGYKGVLELDRDSILEGITYQKLNLEIDSKSTKNDFDEQQIIEEKIGDKTKIDYNLQEDNKTVLSRLLKPFKKR